MHIQETQTNIEGNIHQLKNDVDERIQNLTE